MRLGRRRFSLFALLAAFGGRSALASPTLLAGVDPAGVLGLLAHELFPHDSVSPDRYRRVAEAFLAGNAEQGERLTLAVRAADFATISPPQRLALLNDLQLTPDFQVFRFHTLTMLYADLSVIRDFGYQGPSLEKGGYLTRGFDDIDWLPDDERHAG
jgi:hypothetical protein